MKLCRKGLPVEVSHTFNDSKVVVIVKVRVMKCRTQKRLHGNRCVTNMISAI